MNGSLESEVLEPIASDEQALQKTAERRGIAASYYDIFGNHHQIQAEVLRKIIDSIGPEIPTDPLPPTIVLAVGEERELPEEAEIHLENGETRRVQRLDGSLPPGYHRLRLTGSGFSVFLIVYPSRMWAPEVIRRSSLKEFITWAVKETGASFIALNPLHALHNRSPYNSSPYLPLCSYYRNYLYLDVEQVGGFQSPSVQAQFLNQETQDLLSELRASQYVEYEQVAAIKLRILRLCFESCLKSQDGLFDEYLKQQGKLLQEFALYCALDEYFRQTAPGTWLWTQWPKAYQSPDSPACQEFQRTNEKNILFYCWIQWQLDRQLREIQDYALESGMSIGIYHDLALATDRFGCDLWANQSHFVKGCRVGAPPDDFSPEGQDWAFPPVNGKQHLLDGYQLFIASIRHNATHGGALRLDHVMRVFRLFWIPDGFHAKEGTYVYERWQDLLGIMALESHRLKVRMIGEDLGTITDEMRRGLQDYGVLGYRLLYFERENEGDFKDPQHSSAEAVATTSTHDLPTLTGFWEAKDIEARRASGLLPDDSSYYRQCESRKYDKQKLLDLLHRLNLLPDDFSRDASQIDYLTSEMWDAVFRMLASTPCELLVINQEDLTLECLQQELRSKEDLQQRWRRIREILSESGRI